METCRALRAGTSIWDVAGPKRGLGAAAVLNINLEATARCLWSFPRTNLRKGTPREARAPSATAPSEGPPAPLRSGRVASSGVPAAAAKAGEARRQPGSGDGPGPLRPQLLRLSPRDQNRHTASRLFFSNDFELQGVCLAFCLKFHSAFFWKAYSFRVSCAGLCGERAGGAACELDAVRQAGRRRVTKRRQSGRAGWRFGTSPPGFPCHTDTCLRFRELAESLGQTRGALRKLPVSDSERSGAG